MSLKMQILRTYEEKQTLGILYVLDQNNHVKFNLRSLELPWKKNQVRISCIPERVYKVVKHNSPKFGKSFWVKDVPGRSEILIHIGNYYYNVLGCILPGLDFKDLNKDNLLDVRSSGAAFQKLWDIMPDSFELEIVENQNKINV